MQGFAIRGICSFAVSPGSLLASITIEGAPCAPDDPAEMHISGVIAKSLGATSTPYTSSQSFTDGPQTVAQVVASSGRPLDAGTAMVRAGESLIQIDFHVSIAFKGDGTRCGIFGTAIPTG